MKFVEEHPESHFVHPYDQPSTWNGHATIVHEIAEQLNTQTPAAVVTCVGGGGLAIGLSIFAFCFCLAHAHFLLGVLLGMEQVGWNPHVPLITMETEGSNCFYAALEAGKIVTLDGINSIAKSLGALSVSEKLFELAHTSEHTVKSYTVTDEEALLSCLEFSKLHRMLVEPACGAALAAIFAKPNIFDGIKNDEPIVVIVCGGNMASLELFEEWKQDLLQ